MDLANFWNEFTEDLEKQAAFEEAETKDALEKRAFFINLGRSLADHDMKKIGLIGGAK